MYFPGWHIDPDEYHGYSLSADLHPPTGVSNLEEDLRWHPRRSDENQDEAEKNMKARMKACRTNRFNTNGDAEKCLHGGPRNV